MKLSDGIINCPMTGPCEIDVKKVARCFGKSAIYKYKKVEGYDEYRLVNMRASVKVTIFEKDALELIDLLGLEGLKDPIFLRSTTFRKWS